MTDLSEFRTRIDALDDRLVALIAERMSIVREVGARKAANNLPTMVHDRVAQVLKRVGERAEAADLDAAFVRKIWEALIAEACRIEDGMRGDRTVASAADGKLAGSDSHLAKMAVRIDHVAIAVRDIDAAIAHYRDALGFVVEKRQTIGGEFSGMELASMKAGPITFVLVQGTSPNSNVSRYIEEYGPGVQHLAIEVTGLDGVCTNVAHRGFPLLGEIVQAGGLDQILSHRDPNSGIQLELIERTGENGFKRSSITELFKAMEKEDVY